MNLRQLRVRAQLVGWAYSLVSAAPEKHALISISVCSCSTVSFMSIASKSINSSYTLLLLFILLFLFFLPLHPPSLFLVIVVKYTEQNLSCVSRFRIL